VNDYDDDCWKNCDDADLYDPSVGVCVYVFYTYKLPATVKHNINLCTLLIYSKIKLILYSICNEISCSQIQTENIPTHHVHVYTIT